MISTESRRGDHGVPPVSRYQRSASAPCASSSVHGSITLPSDFDILRPSASTMWPRQTQFLYELCALDQRRDREQRVEPPARLVDRLGDEVGREPLLEYLLVLERVVPLPERHRARVEPCVDHVRDARRRRRALGAVERDLVDVRPMGIEVGQVPDRRAGRAPRRSRCRCRGRRCIARSAAASPSSGRATATSRRCSPASRRSVRT